jgi:dihydroorotase
VSALIITNGRIIDPGAGADYYGDLYIRDGQITTRFPVDSVTEIIDARGMVVSPGFIDLHSHLRDPGFPEKETIATGTLAAAGGGFTTVCCMPNTFPALDTPVRLDYVKSTALAEGAGRVLPIGCITRNREGKEIAGLREMAYTGAIGFSDDGAPVMHSGLLRQALEISCDLERPIMEHCEDVNLSGTGQMNEGPLATELGLPGIPPAAEEIIVARDLMLSRLTGGWIHICHVSTAGAVALIKNAKREKVHVTAEVTPHHLTLTEEAVRGYDTSAKVNPPLRTEKDIIALIDGLNDGTIDCIATDHAPHTVREKALPFTTAPSGISVFETALGSLLGLVHGQLLTVNALINLLTARPARLLGLSDKLGVITPGAAADITIFDPDRTWIVNPERFISRGRNTPLKGIKLRGKVALTICRGRVIYRDADAV